METRTMQRYAEFRHETQARYRVEPARRRAILYGAHDRLVTCDVPEIMFVVLSPFVVLALTVTRTSESADDADPRTYFAGGVLCGEHVSGLGKVCLGTAQHLVNAGLDPVDAFWMSSFQTNPRPAANTPYLLHHLLTSWT